MLKHLSSKEFKEMVENKENFIVDFYADWCGPCKMMAPIFEEAAERYADKVFCKVNVDEAGDIAAEYGVMSIPMFMIFKDGQPVKKQLGAMSEDDFIKFIFWKNTALKRYFNIFMKINIDKLQYLCIIYMNIF